MKRTLSFCLIVASFCASAIPLTAQRTKDLSQAKVRTGDSKNRFGAVNAFSDGSGVLVQWEMSVETNNAGFYVHRLDPEGDVLASDNMILGSALTTGAKPVSETEYSFFDENGGPASVYYVQSLGIDGVVGRSPNASVSTVPDLKSIGAEGFSDAGRGVSNVKQNAGLLANRLQLPRTLAAEVSENESFADPATHAWVISQPGVKIGVRREGFYRVTKAALQAAGFDVNGNSALWQLYREGLEQPLIVGPNGDYIDFFGKPVDKPETDSATYYLIAGPAAGKRIATKVARALSGTVTSPNYAQVSVQKQRTNYVSQILNGEGENWWGSAINAINDTTFNFNLSGVDFTSAQSTLELKFQGFGFEAHSIQVTLNGTSLAPATGASQAPFSAQYTVPTSLLREGANTLVFRSIGSSTDFNLFDSVSVGYRRKHQATQNRLKFYTENYRLSKLDGFSSANVRVFDMTSEAAPVLWTNLNIVQDGATYSVRMPADRGRSMFAVEDSGLLASDSITQNDPTSLKVNSTAAKLLIITHKNFTAQAQNWANYRIGQGFTAKVVDVAEIYDEFGNGDLDSLSIRRFLQYAKDNWQVAPSYVLFIGDSSYDSRNYLGFGYFNLVPTHIVNTIFIETGSDDTLADFDGDGLAEMAVGRIPGRDPQNITNALSKTMAFEAAAPTMQSRGVLFASDCFDAANNYDFSQISHNLSNNLPGNVPVTHIGRCDTVAPPDTPQTLVRSSINTGKYLVNYAGHGTTGAWASQSFFSVNDVPILTNSSNLSIFTMLTCLNGYFLHATNKSLAEMLLDSTTGGAVAAWASTGETTPDVQEIMATRFINRLGNGQLERLGDLIKDAKTVIPQGADVRLSWALIGDPMLKVRTAPSGDRPGKRNQ